MAPGPLGAPEGLRAVPMGSDEAQQGAGGALEELRTEGRLCTGCPPRAPPYSWPGRSLQEPQGHCQHPPFLQVSLMFLFWGHRLLELKVHLTGINI